MFKLDNAVALVTGATGGIGQAIVRALVAQGAQVVATGTRQQKLDELAESSDAITPYAADLGQSESAPKLIQFATTTFGRLDILVNNAGIVRDGLAGRMSEQDWRVVLDLNLTTAFLLCKAACRPMFKQRYGRIINISSIVASTGNPGQANYTAAKAGLIGMTKTLAVEFAPRNITVNAIAPGLIATAMTESMSEKAQQAFLQSIPLGRIGSPEDIAYSTVFLASTESAYITGQTLHINGGMLRV